MKLNIDCIRDIMLYLENTLEIKYDEENYEIIKSEISCMEIIEALSIYSPEDIWYSICILSSNDYIDAVGTEEFTRDFRVTDITYTGHKFIESIKPQPIWNKTKSIISKIGTHTLKFVEDTAQKIAVEYAKSLIYVSNNASQIGKGE